MMTFEEFIKEPSLKEKDEIHKKFAYIISISHYECYNIATEYILPYLRHKEESLQIAAMQGLYTLVDRFVAIDKEALLLLIENLESQNDNILGETLNTLNLIAQCVLKYRKKIFFSFIKNGFDLYTIKQLKKCTDIKELFSLKTSEEKEEFILSFCQHSDNYNEAFSICLSSLQRDECEELNVSAIKGLMYLVLRFEKIDIYMIMPIFLKYLNAAKGQIFGSKYGSELIYVQTLLVDIAYYIPDLKLQAIKLLKKMKSHYVEMFRL